MTMAGPAALHPAAHVQDARPAEPSIQEVFCPTEPGKSSHHKLIRLEASPGREGLEATARPLFVCARGLRSGHPVHQIPLPLLKGARGFRPHLQFHALRHTALTTSTDRPATSAHPARRFATRASNNTAIKPPPATRDLLRAVRESKAESPRPRLGVGDRARLTLPECCMEDILSRSIRKTPKTTG